MSEVDLSELAIDRGVTNQARVRARRHLLSRYVVPAILIVAFATMVGWASWDIMFPPKPVTVVPVLPMQSRQEGTPLFNAAGWIEPRPTSVRVAALAPGVVEQLLVVQDQPVQAGEPVAELVKDDAKLAYERALADLQLRQAEVEEVQAALVAANTRFEQPVHLQASIGEAEASLAKTETLLKNLPFEIRRAEADLKVAQRDYDGKLSARGVVAGVEIDRAKGILDSAKALAEELHDRSDSLEKEKFALVQRRDALIKQLELLADEIKAKDEAEAQLKAARARIKQARVSVAEAKLQLDRMTVRSPIAGRVYQLIADPGTRLSAGMGPNGTYDGSTVVTLYRPEMLQVRVDVRFQDLPSVSLGQPVQIMNPALPSPLTGGVLFVSSEADIQKNTLQVKVAIDTPPPVFKPEMLVDVTFLATADAKQSSTETRLYVPRDLVRQENGASFVWLADQTAGVARKASVQVGAAAESTGLVEIAGRLTVSSRIIARGADDLEDGNRIRVTGEEPTTGLKSGPPQRAVRNTMNRLPAGEHR